MSKNSKMKILTNGLINENPVLRLVLGTCPTLAVTTMAANGIGMGLAATFVLTCSNADYDYVPSALGFDHGGYSADSCHFLPGTGELLAQAFIDLLHGLRQLT